MPKTINDNCNAAIGISPFLGDYTCCHARRSRGGTGPPNDGVGGALCTLGPPTLTPVDRNKTYCFHELVLNLPAPFDIQ